jgi:hypothetical protein
MDVDRGAQFHPRREQQMSIAAAAQAGPPTPARRYSKIADWLEGLDETERDAAMRILRNRAWQHVSVRELFLENGLDVSAQSLGEYRRRLEREPR